MIDFQNTMIFLKKGMQFKMKLNTQKKFQHGMYTHCGVNNFALSVSEAIAKPEISRVIWTISIVVHSPVLLFFSLELTKFYVDYLYNKVKYSEVDTGLT